MFKFLKALSENRWYIIMFSPGFIGAAPYVVQEIHAALEAVGMLMGVALVASLLVAFAAFSYEERVNKWLLQYVPMVAFGAYAMMVVKDFTVIKLLLLVTAMAMHLSYWKSGIHSRNYRLDQYKLGYAAQFPYTTQLIASLNGMGRSELADELVVAILSHTTPQPEFWGQIPSWVPGQLREQARGEFGV